MKKKCLILVFIYFLGLYLISQSTETGTNITNPGKIQANFGNIPLYFIPNNGQVNEDVRFYAKTPGYTLWMLKQGLIFDTIHKTGIKAAGNNNRDVSRFTFLGINKNLDICPGDTTPHKVNYFIGKNRSQWYKNISTSKAVRYKEIYKNIDLKVYGTAKKIEYDWVVKPEGRPGDIRFEYQNVKSTRIDEEGHLRIETLSGELTHQRPFSYQVIKGKKIEVTAEFSKITGNIYGFKVDNYNRAYELVIDPVILLYSTYIGGGDADQGYGIAVDSNGSAYITGSTESIDFPTETPWQYNRGYMDIFVMKFSAAGNSLLYSTYLGGADTDSGGAIAVDNSGNAYITGETWSQDFPTQNAFQVTIGGGEWAVEDAFVTKLSPTGDNLVYSTYLGGSGGDHGRSIAVDNTGNAYVAGQTSSMDFPTQNPFQAAPGHTQQGLNEVFVTKLAPTGESLVYSTYLGGNTNDIGMAIAIDSSGNAYVTGYTSSTDFPTLNPLQPENAGSYWDAFITKLSSSGTSLSYSTYLGGDSDEMTYGIAVDNTGSAYITGSTKSTDFPLRDPFQSSYGGGDRDVFVTKLSPTGNSLSFSTYLGGNNDDVGRGIVIHSSGYPYVTGYTESIDFPTLDAFQENPGGGSDVFVTKLFPPGDTLCYSTYLGGSNFDYGYAIAVDSGGSAYITGYTDSTDFPTQNPFQTNRGNSDVFAVKLASLLTVTSPNGGEVLEVGSIHTITWESDGGVGDVKIEFSADNGAAWTEISAAAENNGSYPWTVPDAVSSQCLVRVSEAADGDPADTSNDTFSIIKTPPEISLDRTQLNFSSTGIMNTSSAQYFRISNSGGGNLNWQINKSDVWIVVTPSSGTDAGLVSVSVNTGALTHGTYTGALQIIDNSASNSPQTVNVTLVVKSVSSDENPFGQFDTPLQGSTVSSSVPFTGWALDDIEVESVKIYREDGNNLVYIGDTVFVEGARPDIETSFPAYPLNYRAGWGYMMLTNFLPNGGNGTFTLHAIAKDSAGHEVTLGTRTITCDNANAVKPFGALDTPTQGGTASGEQFTNYGWALTPTPNTIPTDGSTITVWVDGAALGNPVYNRYREDIATLFPGYNNSNGAVGYFSLDTTQYENGVHTISWTVEDDAGNSDGIGSRYFNVQNTAGSREQGASWHGAWGMEHGVGPEGIENVSREPVEIVKGYKQDAEHQRIYPDNKGNIIIEINQLERVEIHLDQSKPSSFIIHNSSFYPGYSAYHRVGRQLKSLPIGSTFDPGNGIFYWMPGPASIGNYEFVFIEKTRNGDMNKKHIIVRINPKR